MLFIGYTLIALFIAWIWVDYYRLIDIYEVEELKFLIITFFLGFGLVWLVFPISYLFQSVFNLQMRNDFLNDLLYTIFKIGMIEELVKLLPLLLFLWLKRKHLDEPIDIIAYACIGALGFAAAENIMYFSNYGAAIISGRSVLSTVAHMTFTAIAAYGIMRFYFFKGKKPWVGIILYFSIAAVCHGLYDFYLMYRPFGMWGYLITVFFFLELISLFAIILNNALNNSPFFTYKEVMNPEKIEKRLLIYYFIVFVSQFVLLAAERGIAYSAANLGLSTFTTAFILYICVRRLSRYKLIRDRWFPLKFELPFSFTSRQNQYPESKGFSFQIKGEGYNEYYLNKHYQAYFWLNPLNRKKGPFKDSILAFMEHKLFFKNDEAFYLCRIFEKDKKSSYKHYLIKPKMRGTSFTNKKSPIFGIYEIGDRILKEVESFTASDFKFVEWAYPKGYEDWQK